MSFYPVLLNDMAWNIWCNDDTDCIENWVRFFNFCWGKTSVANLERVANAQSLGGLLGGFGQANDNGQTTIGLIKEGKLSSRHIKSHEQSWFPKIFFSNESIDWETHLLRSHRLLGDIWSCVGQFGDVQRLYTSFRRANYQKGGHF